MRLPPKKEGFFCVGVITVAHGIKGEVIVKSFTDIPENILEYGTLVDLQDVPFSFSSMRASAKGFIAKINTVHNRNQAEKLRSTYLYASLDKLPKLADDNIYLDDLVGNTIIKDNGSVIGKVRSHFNNGAQTIINVKLLEAGKKDILLPFIDELIIKVDHEAKSITVSEMVEDFLAL